MKLLKESMHFDDCVFFVQVCIFYINLFLADITRSLEDINLSVFLYFVVVVCLLLLLFFVVVFVLFLGGVLFSWGVFLLGNSGSRRGRIHFLFFNSINEPALKRFPLCFATKIRLPSKGPKRFTFTFCRQSNFVPELLCGPG